MAEIVVKILELVFNLSEKLYEYLMKKKIEKKRKSIIDSGTASDLSAVLEVMIGDGIPIGADVNDFINSTPSLCEELRVNEKKEIPLLYTIIIDEKIEFSRKTKKNAAITEFEAQLHTVSKELKELGVKRIHLFFCGPAILMGKIGAKFANRFTVLAYHYDKSIRPYYHYVGPLE